MISVCWIIFIAIAFILPTANPVNSQTLNYSIVAVGIVITYSVGFCLISARKWFTGPIKQIEGKSPTTLSCGLSLKEIVAESGDDAMSTIENKVSPENLEKGPEEHVKVVEAIQ